MDALTVDTGCLALERHYWTIVGFGGLAIALCIYSHVRYPDRPQQFGLYGLAVGVLCGIVLVASGCALAVVVGPLCLFISNLVSPLLHNPIVTLLVLMGMLSARLTF
jgi:hypothetical protein